MPKTPVTVGEVENDALVVLGIDNDRKRLTPLPTSGV
jgi:hypothetical protein